MIASSVVTKINRMNPDWTPAQILDIVNDIHTMCFKRESVHLIYLDPTTGNLPYLATQAGIFTYNVSIPGKTLWKVGEIVIDADKPPPFAAETNQNFDRWQRSYQVLSRNFRVCPARKDEAIGRQTAVVTFMFDPGTHTDLYRIAAYEAPPVITGLGQSLMWHDGQIATVVACVQGLLDAQDNGRFPEAWADVEAKWLPALIHDNEKDETPVFGQNYSW